MKKPFYLLDPKTDKLYELPQDNQSKIIGRSPNAFIKTPYDDNSISKVQLTIQHRPDGVYIRQESERVSTEIGTKDFPETETIYSGDTRQLLTNEYLTMGTHGQRFVLKSYKDLEKRLKQEEEELKQEEKERLSDTSNIKF